MFNCSSIISLSLVVTVHVMDPQLKNLIFEKVSEKNSWTQSIKFSYLSKKPIKLERAIGDKPMTPKGAEDHQPKNYPTGTVYRFDPTYYRHKESQVQLKKDIFKACVGCTMYTSHNAECRSRQRVVEAYFGCNCALKQNVSEDSTFPLKQMAKEGIKKETVKRRKTAGEKSVIDKMSSTKKLAPSARLMKEQEYSVNQPDARRCTSSRAMSDDEKCKMKIKVFMDYNGYWYLSSNGCLSHNDHPYIPPKATITKEARMTEDAKTLVGAMYKAGISPAKIADVVESYCGEGQVISKTMINMGEKMKQANEVLRGVTHDMSTSEKAICYLKRFVYFLLFLH